MSFFHRFSSLTQNKAVLFQLLAFGTLAVIFIVLGIFLLRPSSPTQDGSVITPTPQVVVFTTPNNGASNVGIYDTITLTFSIPLTPDQQRDVAIIADPPILADRQWQEDNKTLVLTPQTALTENQRYRLKIDAPIVKSSLSFTTTTAAQTTKQEITSSGLTEQEVARQYPWYKNLPLFTGKYFVTFDLEKKVFNAKLFISRPAQTNVLKDLIKEHLREMGVDLTKYQIVWEIEE